MAALARRSLTSRLLAGRGRVLVGMALPLALLILWDQVYWMLTFGAAPRECW